MRKIKLAKDLLYKLYIVEKMTLKEISEELGVSRQTVSNKIQEYGYTIRNSVYIKEKKESQVSPPKLKRRTPYKSKTLFEKAYKDLKSLDMVAEHFRISQDTAFAWKKKHGIATIKEFSQKGREKVNINKPYTNKEWLEEMYSKYSWEDLGKMLNCHPTTLSKWGVKLGIQTRSLTEQWDLKTKNGNRVMQKQDFNMCIYKDTYVMSKISEIPKNLKKYIVGLYGACECCGYEEVLDLHHIDENHRNNNPSNHGILCPNCHAKIHRLGVSFEELVPNHVSWETLL